MGLYWMVDPVLVAFTWSPLYSSSTMESGRLVLLPVITTTSRVVSKSAHRAKIGQVQYSMVCGRKAVAKSHPKASPDIELSLYASIIYKPYCLITPLRSSFSAVGADSGWGPDRPSGLGTVFLPIFLRYSPEWLVCGLPRVRVRNGFRWMLLELALLGCWVPFVGLGVLFRWFGRQSLQPC